jgi:hypothetical protein
VTGKSAIGSSGSSLAEKSEPAKKETKPSSTAQER